MSVRLIVDSATFRTHPEGPSTGEIWLSIGNLEFPARHWDDFVVVILEAWVAAILRLRGGSSVRERVHFMEGPYEVAMTRMGHDLQFQALERGLRGTVERANAQVQMNMFVADLLDTCEHAASVCRRSGDTSVDAQQLQRGVSALRASIAAS